MAEKKEPFGGKRAAPFGSKKETEKKKAAPVKKAAKKK